MSKFRGFLGFAIIGLLTASGARAYPHPCHNYGESLYDASRYYTINGNAWLGCKAEGEVGPVCGDPEFVLMPTNAGTCHICVPSEYTAAIQNGNWGVFHGYPDLTCLGCVAREILAEKHFWWPLDERSGTVAAELGWGYYGARSGSPVPVPGRVNYGLQFDGVDDYVEVQDYHNVLDFTGDFTIMAWIKAAPADLSGVRPIVEKRQASPLRGYGFYLYRNAYYHPNGFQLVLQLADGSPGAGYKNYGSAASNNTLDGGWHLVAVSVSRNSSSNSRATFYVDGEQLGEPVQVTSTLYSIANDSVLRIGMSTALSPSRFKGVIDEVMMFDRAFEASEVQSLFGAGPFGMCRQWPW